MFNMSILKDIEGLSSLVYPYVGCILNEADRRASYRRLLVSERSSHCSQCPSTKPAGIRGRGMANASRRVVLLLETTFLRSDGCPRQLSSSVHNSPLTWQVDNGEFIAGQERKGRKHQCVLSSTNQKTRELSPMRGASAS